MEVTKLSIDSIEASTQTRVELNDRAIEEYRDVWLASSRDENPFPPITVFFDGKTYWLGGGAHRIQSARAAARRHIDAEVREGDKRAALLFGMQDNKTHGVRPTPADKRKAVIILLEDPEWRKKSVRWLADTAGVSTTLVTSVKKRMAVKNRKAIGRDGKKRRVKRRATRRDPSAREHTPKSSSAVFKKNACSSCGARWWRKTDRGLICDECLQPLDEPEEDFVEIPEAWAPIEIPAEIEEIEEAPMTPEEREKQHKKARSAFGVLVRYFRKHGIDDAGHLEAMAKILG